MPASAASSTLTQSVSGGSGMASTATASNRVPEISELPPAINRVPATGFIAAKRRYPRINSRWRHLGESDFERCNRNKRFRRQHIFEPERQFKRIHERQRLRLCIRFAVSLPQRKAGVLAKHARVAAAIYSARRQLDRQLWRQCDLGRCRQAQGTAGRRLCRGARLGRHARRNTGKLCSGVQRRSNPKAISLAVQKLV